MASPQQTGTPVKTPASGATIRGNANAATEAAGGGQGKCDFCDRAGLPILPLRYAVVPGFLSASVVDPFSSSQLGGHLKKAYPKPLLGHRYALRTLRKGYLMVYLGSGLWHAYVVSSEGHLRKLADIDDPDSKNDREMSPACKRAGHNVPASFVTIPALPKGKTRVIPSKVWLAFSDVLWTAEVRRRYERIASGAAESDLRFQSFMTSALGRHADIVHDAFQLPPDEAQTSQRLNSLVLEYAADEAQADGRTHYDAIDPYDPKKRNRMPWASAHGISMRVGEAAAVAQHAKKLTPSYRDELMASAVVLDDPVGTTIELNASRLRVVENRQRVLSDERIARPLLISQTIIGLKGLIDEQSRAAVEEEEKGQPDIQTETSSYTMPYGVTVMRTQQTTTREQRAKKRSNAVWSSLQKHYRENERIAFEKRTASTIRNFQDWLVKYDADYAQWLGNNEWFRRTRDFDLDLPDQRDLFHEVMADVLSGGPTSSPDHDSPAADAPQDTQVYEVWKRFFALSPSDENNPIYVAIFGYDKEILDYLTPDGMDPIVDGDKVDKFNRLYQLIKGRIATPHWENNSWGPFREEVSEKGVKGLLTSSPTGAKRNPWRNQGVLAIAALVASIPGAASRMPESARKLAEATALRAVQAATLLYEKTEIYFVTARVRLRDYLAYMQETAFDVGLGAARSVTRVGKRVVNSMAIAGALYVTNRKVADALMEVVFWVGRGVEKTSQVSEALSTQADALSQARASRIAAMAKSMAVHPITLSPKASEFVGDLSAQRQAAQEAKEAKRNAILNDPTMQGKYSRVLAVVGAAINLWALKDAVTQVNATFASNNEARVAVGVASLAMAGAAVEVAGVAMALKHKVLPVKIPAFRFAGVLVGFASVVDGMKAAMASYRTATHGDTDAAVLYGAAATCLVVGGGLSMYAAASTAALLGPAGVALLLIAAGVMLVYFAMRAEDSQIAIWLRRCYWGTDDESERWKDSQMNEELAHLNAIIIGMSAEVGFNDDGWGFADFSWDTVKARLRFPNYTPGGSFYEWKLSGRREDATEVVLFSGQYPDASAEGVTPRGAHGYALRNFTGPALSWGEEAPLVIEMSVEVRDGYFSDVVLSAEYVPDKSDPGSRGLLELRKED